VIAPNFDQLPVNLPSGCRYVTWQQETRQGTTTKVPYRANGHRRASVTNPSSWCALDEARACVERGDAHGLGLVLTGDLTVADLDNCLDPVTYAPTPLARLVLAQLPSYTEFSPSRGLHTLMLGTLPPGRRRTTGLELYDTKRFITLTGVRVAGTPRQLVDQTDALGRLHAQLFPRTPRVTPVPASPPLTPDDAVLLAKARHARNGARFRTLWDGTIAPYASHSEADAALCSILSFWTARDPTRVDRLFRQSGLFRRKWDTRRNGTTYGADTIAFACATTLGVYRPACWRAEDVEVPMKPER
jgi:putative DNA primase/helicase